MGEYHQALKTCIPVIKFDKSLWIPEWSMISGGTFGIPRFCQAGTLWIFSLVNTNWNWWFRMSAVKYCKIPRIRPGLIFVKSPFWGAYIRRVNCFSKSARLILGREICIWKSIGLGYSWKEIYVSNLQKGFTETLLEDVDLSKTQPRKYFV